MSKRSLVLAGILVAAGAAVWIAAGGPSNRPSDVPLSPQAGAETLPPDEAVSPGATGSR